MMGILLAAAATFAWILGFVECSLFKVQYETIGGQVVTSQDNWCR